MSLAADRLSLARHASAAARVEQLTDSRVWWRDSLRRRMLAAADVATVTVFCLSIAVLLDGHVVSAFWAEALLPVWIVLAKVHGLYDRDHRTLRHLTADEIPSIFLWVVTGTAATILLVPGLSGHALTPARMTEPFLIAFASAVCFRCAARAAWRRLLPPDRTLVIGEGASARAAQRKLELFREIHARPVAMLPLTTGEDVAASWDELRSLRLDRILLAASVFEDDLITALIGFCRMEHVKLSVVPPARGQLGAGVQLVHVAELPVLEYNTSDVSRSTIFLKHLLDVCVATFLLVLVLPLVAIVALAILVEDGRPVLFSQTRAGVGGRPFRMWKFRTMVVGAEALLADLVPFDELEEPVFKLRRDPRVTRVGRIIRRFSLDELPQIINVLRGEMSIVGPRPEQADLVDRYSPEQRVRLGVKPGLTGPMQVYGRGELSLEERIAVERDYIENMSLGRDLRILAMTVAPVLTGRGAF
jgi:exopolysaccharide biosynthesis polyprenyl glycosylphosphotransferase